MWFQRDAVLEEVARLFAPAVTKNGKYSGLRVRSTMSPPSLASDELLVYLVPNYDFSVLKSLFGVDVKEAAGRTIVERAASDVYIAGKTMGGGSGEALRMDWLTNDPPAIHVEFKRDPKVIAQVIFHEALHNKGRMDGRKLHNQKGPKEALFRSLLTEDSRLTPEDTALMAKHIDDKRPQWTGGWNQLG